jgi:hypothetical protein
MKNKLLKIVYWFLAPFLDDYNKPSIKRFLIFLFAFEIHNVINARPWNLQTSIIITIFVVTIGILLGLTTYSTLIKILERSKTNQTEEQKDE